MTKPMSCCRGGGYCDRCDVLVGLDGLHVIGVDRDQGGGLLVRVESAPGLGGLGPEPLRADRRAG
jgi:transposase